MRADDDLFVCGSLVDALQRSGLDAAAQSRLYECLEDLDDAQQNGWDSLSLQLGRLRLLILSDETEQSLELLATLFDRGMRATGILLNDPVLSRLGGTEAYQDVVDRTRGAVEKARNEIAALPPK